MPKMNVKKGDTVEVISGKDKGKQGLVLRTYPEEGKVLVEGVDRGVQHVHEHAVGAERREAVVAAHGVSEILLEMIEVRTLQVVGGDIGIVEEQIRFAALHGAETFVDSLVV